MSFALSKRIVFLLLIGIGGSLQNDEMRTDKEVLEDMEGQYERIDDMLIPSGNARMSWDPFTNWPNGELPYMISENVTSDLRAIVAEAIAYYHKHTCIRFRQKTNDDTYWLRFLMDSAASASTLCAATTGFTEKPDQEVLLGPKCKFGSMVHELLHSLGFFHEHTRMDRDKYITVHWENMAEDSKSSYYLDKTICDANPTFPCTFSDYGVKYNYESIMHYCDTCTAISYDKKTFTIIPGMDAVGDPNRVGQREGFSEGDWLMVNRKYECNLEATTKPKPISAKPNKQKPSDKQKALPIPTLPTTPKPPPTDPPKKTCKRKMN